MLDLDLPDDGACKPGESVITHLPTRNLICTSADRRVSFKTACDPSVIAWRTALFSFEGEIKGYTPTKAFAYKYNFHCD